MYLKHFPLIIFIIFLCGCKAINLQPQSGNLSEYVEIQNRANEAYQKEDWATAEKDYIYLAKNNPSDIEPWFRLGNIYARTGKLDAAVAAYREALVRDQKNSKIWHNLGVVQLRQATNTFIEMLEYTNQADPLNQRARYVISTVSDLMVSGFEASGTE